MSSELLSVKIEKSKYNQILNWISTGVQFSAMCPFKFLIFLANKLLSAKIEEFKTNYIYMCVCVYNEKPFHILEVYGLKKV